MKNIKRIFLFSACILTVNFLHAQAFDDGKNLIFAGFGFPAPSTIQKDFDQYKKFIDYNFKNYGTVVVKYERGLQKYFGIGLNLEYSAASVSYKYDDVNTLRYEVKVNTMVAGAFLRLNAHLPIGDNLDIYGGAGLGYLYRVDNYTDTKLSNSTSLQKSSIFDFDYQLTLGVRYMVKKNFGLFLEGGRATTIAQLGIALGF